jgi:hypothetical protein
MYKKSPFRLAKLAFFLAAGLASGVACDKKQAERSKDESGGACRAATIAWKVSGEGSGLRKAGLSTQPDGFADRLMPAVPNLVRGWVEACRKKKQWRCKQTAVVWFEVDGKGAATETGSFTRCPAARCLRGQAAKTALKAGLLPASTRVCLYIKPKNDGS